MLVFGAVVVCAVVCVSEVEGLAGLDWLPASCAGCWCCVEDLLPLLAELLVLMSVSALCGGSSCLLGFSGVLWAFGCAVGCDAWTSGCVAAFPGHFCPLNAEEPAGVAGSDIFSIQSQVRPVVVFCQWVCW